MGDTIFDAFHHRLELAQHMQEVLKETAKKDNKLCRLEGSIKKIHRIGTKSVYGQVFLVEERKHPQHLAAAKVMYDTKGNRAEVRWYRHFERMVTGQKTPHFPILYFHRLCRNTCALEAEPKDTTSKDPKHCMVVVSELAKGDLRTWIENGSHPVRDYYSMLAQLFMGLWILMEENVSHNDLHWGNLLYHETPHLKGKWMTYRVGDYEIKIRNTGAIWVLWDFGKMRMSPRAWDVMEIDAYRILHFPKWATSEKWKVPKSVARLCEVLREAIKESDSLASVISLVLPKIPKDVWAGIEKVVQLQWGSAHHR